MQPIWLRATRTRPWKIQFSASSIACTLTSPITVQRAMVSSTWATARQLPRAVARPQLEFLSRFQFDLNPLGVRGAVGDFDDGVRMRFLFAHPRLKRRVDGRELRSSILAHGVDLAARRWTERAFVFAS